MDTDSRREEQDTGGFEEARMSARATRRQQLRKKGIYLFPNLFTTAALFGGFYAIVMAMNQRYEFAAMGIFCAMILDGFDGRVARLTGTASEFGEQYDSLSDMVSFGAAPALVVYEWALHGCGKPGWIAAFIFCACGALRLARFNTNIGVVDKRFFQGLPSPSAAGIVAGFVWFMTDMEITGEEIRWIALALTVFAGLSMVTNIPFYSFKVISFRRSVPFIVLVLIVLIISLIVYLPAGVLFITFMGYGISGYLYYLWHRLKGRKVSVMKKDESQESPEAPQ